MLEDDKGLKLPAKTVFSLAIRYLKDDLKKTCANKLLQGNLEDDEIHWVLTVPAIWNDQAKAFMREAAVEVRHLSLFSLWKHAYSNILRILPPKNENFQMKNSGSFHIFALNIVSTH